MFKRSKDGIYYGWLVVAAGTFIEDARPLSGIMKDVTGAYTIPFAIGGLCLLFASVVSFSIQEKRYSSRYVSVPEPATR